MEALPITPSFRLDGKRALITGAGRGIGAAFAAALADAGAAVTLCARSGAEVEAIAATIRARGQSAEALALDVTDQGAVFKAIDAAPAFNILINNAGTNRPKAFTDVTVEDYDAVIDLNVKAAFFVAQAVARKMIAAGATGSMINMSSQLGHVGAKGRTIYSASKFAIEGLTKAMALDLAPYGIRVNTIAPTLIETPLTRPYFEDKAFLESMLAKIKTGRVGQVQDLMGAAVFLCSDAAAMITGTSLLVDGGWTAD